MSNVPDLEIGKETANSDGKAASTAKEGEVEAKRQVEAKKLKSRIEDENLQFSKARQGAEERMGVLLLLEYREALMRMNLKYRNFVMSKGYPNEHLPEIVEQYGKGLLLSPRWSWTMESLYLYLVKSYERYQCHLDRRPDSYETKEIYDKHLQDMTVSVFVLRTTLDVIRRSRFGLYIGEDTREFVSSLPNVSDDNFKPALDLAGPECLRPTVEIDFSESTGPNWEEIEAGSRRAVFGVAGGFTLIIPMLIMKLYPTTLNVCLTTTVSVFIIALSTGFAMSATKPKDVLSITAAYAAVLVVFVGTSTTQGGLENATVAKIMGAVTGGLLLLTILSVYIARQIWSDLMSRYTWNAWKVAWRAKEEEGLWKEQTIISWFTRNPSENINSTAETLRGHQHKASR